MRLMSEAQVGAYPLERSATMIALKTLTTPRLRMFALAAMAAATLGVAAVPPASATSNTDHLPTRKQVCYLDPVKGKVCQWVWVNTGGLILPAQK
jgi:hypothetical protein